MKIKLLVLLCLLFQSWGCKQDSTEVIYEEELVEFGLPSWTKNTAAYQMTAGQFSAIGNYAEVEDLLDRLKDMGVGLLWLNDVHVTSNKHRDVDNKITNDSLNSASDNKTINPDYGTLEEFRILLKACHTKGVKIIMDWESKQQYNGMQDDMLYWIRDVGVDGYAIEGAEELPQDVWDSIATVLSKAYPEIVLLVDSEMPVYRNISVLDADYGSEFQLLLEDIVLVKKNATDIDKWYADNTAKYTEGFQVHKTSVDRLNASSDINIEYLEEACKAIAVLTFTIDGMPVLSSSMQGATGKGLLSESKGNTSSENDQLGDFYKRLFLLKKNNRAIWNGKFGGDLVKLVEHDNIYAFKREKNGDTVIGIINLSNQRQSFTIPEAIKGKDIFTGQRVHWNEETALGMEPWQYYILSNR